MRSAAAVEERLLVPTYASRWSPLSVAAHRVLALPLQLRGTMRRRVVESDGREITVLESGVNDGDMVVIDGHLQLTNGARVAVRPAKKATS